MTDESMGAEGFEDAAEGEGVRHRDLDLRLTRDIRHHVERAFRIGFFISDGGGDDALA